jgi:hypothetical protein
MKGHPLFVDIETTNTNRLVFQFAAAGGLLGGERTAPQEERQGAVVSSDALLSPSVS